MAWNEAVVTGKGLELLTECVLGGDIEICRAAGGESCSPAISLMALTEIDEPCHCLKIGGIKKEEGKITVNIRAQNAEDGGGYFLRKIGLFARSAGTGDNENEVLFAVIQDMNGEEVPAFDDNPEFLSEFDFVIPISNADKITARVDPDFLVTAEELDNVRKGIDNEISRIDDEIDALDKRTADNFKDFSAHKNNGAVHISAADKRKLDGIVDNANNYSLPLASASVRGGAKIGYAANGKNYPVQLSDEKMFVNVPWTDTNTVYTHPATSGNKHIPAGGSSGQILRWSADGTAAWGADVNTTYSSMTAATASTAGKAGLVPAPAAGAQMKYLRGDGTWQTPPDTNTTYNVASQSANGLMSAADKKKLDEVAASANNYSLPPASASVRGGAKIGYAANGKNYPVQLSNERMFVNVPWTDTDTVYSHPTTSGNKHIPAGGSSGQILRWSADGTAVWGSDNNTTYSNMTAATALTAGKAGLVPAPAAGAQAKYLRGDGTWQTPPDTNTTYSAATATTAGLMSAADKAKLDGVAASANNYTHPTAPGSKHIPSGGAANQILVYSASGTAKWSSSCNAAAINVVSGTVNTGNQTVAYQTGRTKALIEAYPTKCAEGYGAYYSVLLTGLSSSMTARNPETGTAFSGSSGLTYSVSAGGNITIAGYVGRYCVTWFN